MYTLHIEHPITDFATWAEAFDRFADLRLRSGVRDHTVWRPIDDDRYVVVNLTFDTEESATAFRDLLRTRVWAIPSNSPALDGDPQTRILTEVGTRS